MDFLPFALLSLIPSVGLLIAYPRRHWAALTSTIVCAGVAAALLETAEAGRFSGPVAAAWNLAACAYGFYICRRDASHHETRQAQLAAFRARRGQTAKALEHVKAKGLEAGREQKETEALYGIIKGLAEAMTWEEIRPKIELAIDQYLGVEGFALYAADMRESDSFHPLTAKNVAGSVGESWVTLSRYLQEHGLKAASPNILTAPERGIALPIEDNSEVLGYLYARVPKGVEPAALLAKAWAFTAEISFAFRRVKLFQEVERLSRIDGLTGVYRRGDFDERIKEETIRAKTFKTTCALMLLDIDHFKKLNDRYGHPFGDQVLKRVGELLNSLVYDTDFVARYGGEEFVILLPRAESAGALRKAEAIRRAIEAEPFSIALESVPVTVSIGIAHFPRDAASPHELIAQADQAMYQAKSQGRNRVLDYAAQRS